MKNAVEFSEIRDRLNSKSNFFGSVRIRIIFHTALMFSITQIIDSHIPFFTMTVLGKIAFQWFKTHIRKHPEKPSKTNMRLKLRQIDYFHKAAHFYPCAEKTILNF